MDGFNITGTLVNSIGMPVIFSVIGKSDQNGLTLPMELEDLEQLSDGKATLIVYEPENMSDQDVVLTKITSDDSGMFSHWQYRQL